MLATSGQYNAALPIIETLVKSQPNNAHFWRIYCNILEGGYYTTRAKQAMREGAKRFNLKALELRADFLQAPIYAKTADLISAQQNLYAQADKWLLEAPEIADLESQCDAILNCAPFAGQIFYLIKSCFFVVCSRCTFAGVLYSSA